MTDPINHPPHYTSHKSGVECLTITRHMGFNLGNAVKYIWRCDLKGGAIDDLRKAVFYIQDEIMRREEAATGDEGKKLVWAVTDKSGPVFQGKPRHYPANQPPERK